MSEQPINVLVIEDNPAQARLLKEMLATTNGGFQIARVAKMSEGLRMLVGGGIDVVLLDLSLPDVEGLDSLISLHAQFPEVPIVVLTGLDDEKVAVEAVKLGAQDYLVKGQVTGAVLSRSLRYAIERKAAEERIRQLNEERERRLLELASANKTLDNLTRQLMRARDQALEAASFKTDFVARVSHEIRTPLSAVTGMIELLLKTPLNAEQQQFARAVHGASLSLLESINSILDLANIEAGRMELDSIDFAPVVLVEESAAVLAPAAREKDLALMTFVDPELPPLIAGDPVRVRQILANLITNAVQYTARGAVSVQATKHSEDATHVIVRFSVSDTGIGLSDVAKRQLFEPVIHANGLAVRKYFGPGLGLSICRRLVELMGGQIGVESEEGDGATFWFSVPFRRSTSVRGGPISYLAASASHLRDVKVLVVDDNLTSSHILKTYLGAARLRCDRVANQAEAVDRLHKARTFGEPYEVTIVSLSPQPEAGLKLIGLMSEDDKQTRTILLVSRHSPEVAHEVERRGGEVIVRPLRQSDLIEAIEKVMHRAGSALENSFKELVRANHALSAKARTDEGTLILLAEDDSVLQQLVVVQLIKLGYQVHVAASGNEAVKAAASYPYALILMDCQMPGMDGLEATRRIRQEEKGARRHVPIVAMTASAMPGDRESCLESGMDDYVCKPVNLEQLKAMVERWVEAAGREVESEDEGGPDELDLSHQGQPINLSRLKDIYGSQAASEMLPLFVKETRLLIDKAKEALRDRDAKKGAIVAHQLVGVSASVAADQMHLLSLDLERKMKAADWDSVVSALPELEEAFTRVEAFGEGVSGDDDIRQGG